MSHMVSRTKTYRVGLGVVIQCISIYDTLFILLLDHPNPVSLVPDTEIHLNSPVRPL